MNTLPANFWPRVFLYETRFYTIFDGYIRKILFGERPRNLAKIKAITKRVLRQHKTYQDRLNSFPLDRAGYYLKLKKSIGTKSIRALADYTGEDWSYVAKIMRTLELPEPIKCFLQSHKNDPEFIKFFHLRRLLDMARRGDEKLQFVRFQNLLEEFENEKKPVMGK